MARPRKTDEQRAVQRRHLQHVAREIYRETGLTGVTVRSVASAAEVAPGTIYSYFDSIGDLLRSLWLEPVRAADKQLVALCESHPDPLDRIRALLVAYVDFAHANPDVARGALLFVRPRSQDLAASLSLDDLPFHRLLVEAIDEASAQGSIRPTESALLAQVLWSGVHGSIALPINAEAYDLDTSDAPTTLMIDMLISSLVAEPA